MEATWNPNGRQKSSFGDQRAPKEPIWSPFGAQGTHLEPIWKPKSAQRAHLEPIWNPKGAKRAHLESIRKPKGAQRSSFGGHLETKWHLEVQKVHVRKTLFFLSKSIDFQGSDGSGGHLESTWRAVRDHLGSIWITSCAWSPVGQAKGSSAGQAGRSKRPKGGPAGQAEAHLVHFKPYRF